MNIIRFNNSTRVYRTFTLRSKKDGKEVIILKGNILNGGVSMLTLSQIREKNRTNTSLLGSKIEERDYSEELIRQCKEEFETFVNPIVKEVIGRMLKEK